MKMTRKKSDLEGAQAWQEFCRPPAPPKRRCSAWINQHRNEEAKKRRKSHRSSECCTDLFQSSRELIPPDIATEVEQWPERSSVPHLLDDHPSKLLSIRCCADWYSKEHTEYISGEHLRWCSSGSAVPCAVRGMVLLFLLFCSSPHSQDRVKLCRRGFPNTEHFFCPICPCPGSILTELALLQDLNSSLAGDEKTCIAVWCMKGRVQSLSDVLARKKGEHRHKPWRVSSSDGLLVVRVIGERAAGAFEQDNGERVPRHGLHHFPWPLNENCPDAVW